MPVPLKTAPTGRKNTLSRLEAAGLDHEQPEFFALPFNHLVTGRPVLPPLSMEVDAAGPPFSAAQGAARPNLGSLPEHPPALSDLLVLWVEQMVQSEVKNQVKRFVKPPLQTPAEQPTHPLSPIDVSDDELIRALMGRMEVLAQEKRFRLGLVR